MPRKPEWTNRLDEALEELRSLPAPSLDRAALERLLHLSPRQALRILQSLPGAHPVGKSLAIGRADLAAWLEARRQSEPVRAERVRLEKVRGQLETIRRQAQARAMAIGAQSGGAAGAPGRGFEDLPAGLLLEAGRLEIAFSTGEDLLGKLLSLAQAVAADPERFQSLTAPNRD